MMQTNRVPTITGEWECTECGCIVEGVETRRPPACPECDAPADALEFFAYDEDTEDDWEEEAEDELDALDDEEDLEDEDYYDDDDEFDDEQDY